MTCDADVEDRVRRVLCGLDINLLLSHTVCGDSKWWTILPGMLLFFLPTQAATDALAQYYRHATKRETQQINIQGNGN